MILSNKSNRKYRAAVALLISSAIWGVAGPVIKATLSYTPPYTFLFIRCLVASSVLIPILILNINANHHKIKIKDLPHLIALGLLGTTLNLSLVFEAFKRTTSLEGTIISSIGPVFTVLAGALILNEEVTKKEKIGISITLIGALLLVLDPIVTAGDKLRISSLTGNLLMFASLLVWTVYVLYSKKIFNHRRHYSPLTITTFLFLTGAVTFAPASFLEYTKNSQVYNQALTQPAIWGILYMAVLSSVVAYFAYEYALERIEASESAIFSYLNPIWAAPIAILILHEKVSPVLAIGSIIIITGIALPYAIKEPKGKLYYLKSKVGALRKL